MIQVPPSDPKIGRAAKLQRFKLVATRARRLVGGMNSTQNQPFNLQLSRGGKLQSGMSVQSALAPIPIKILPWTTAGVTS